MEDNGSPGGAPGENADAKACMPVPSSLHRLRGTRMSAHTRHLTVVLIATLILLAIATVVAHIAL